MIVVKILYLSYLLYNYGIIMAIVLAIVSQIIVRNIFYYFLGMRELTSIENTFAICLKEDKFTMTGFLILDKWNPHEVKRVIIEKGVKKFSKLRENIINKFGGYYWCEVPLEEAVKSVIINDDIIMKTMEDILNHQIEQQSIPIELDKVQYEFQLCKYESEKMVLFMKFDHSLSDGIGFLSFLMALADNYDINMFPQLKPPSIWQSLILNLLSPYYMFKSHSTDINMNIQENVFKRTTGPIKGKRIIKLGKKYNFTQVTKLAKSLGLTFNEFITSIISKSTKAYLKQVDHYDSTKSIICAAPVSIRTMPKSLADYTIDNSATAISYELPLIDDIKAENSKIKSSLINLKDLFLIYGNILRYSLLTSIVSTSHLMESCHDYASNLSLVISNVPGPKSQLIYAGTKVSAIIPTPNPGFYYTTLIIITYNGEFNFTLATDSNVDLNASLFMKTIEYEMDRILQS